jgi:hypothetical protein
LKRIDLHTHTTASDGTLSPTELVRLARGAGLAAVAVTDHDTVDGLGEALEAGRALGLEVVPGIEISAEFQPGTMHMLGYFIQPDRPVFAEKLRVLQEARRDRNPIIAEKLNALGLAVTMDEVRAAAGGEQVGRPNFARVLLDKGYVSSMGEAFDRYLTKGGPAYVDKFRLSPADSVELIHQAGGLAVLAHPFTLGLGEQVLETFVADLAACGLDGLEVYYPEHDPDQTRACLELAARHGLAVTGGSDFHGDNKPEVALGSGFQENLAVPAELLEALRRRLNRAP